jgi:hypothetical protein
MAQFEPSVDLELTDLPLNTLYRFAEIEMSFAFQTTFSLFKDHAYPVMKATTLLQSMLGNFMNEEEASNFHELINAHMFRQPHKLELIYYFRFNKVAYNKITAITGISPNTISKNKFYDYRERFPIFRFWTPERLETWNQKKGCLNIFDEPLHHYDPKKENKNIF